MVKVVLDNAMQHEVDRVVLYRDDIIQEGIIYWRNGFAEGPVTLLEGVKCGPPRLLGDVSNGRPIHVRRRILKRLSLQPSQAYGFPRCDVEDYFPDAMNSRQRPVS